MKKIPLIFCLFLAFNALIAQDSLFLKDGRSFKCKRIQSDSLTVYFTYVSQGSRISTNVKWADVDRIKFEENSFYYKIMPDTNSLQLTFGTMFQFDLLAMEFIPGLCTVLNYTHNFSSNIGLSGKMIYNQQNENFYDISTQSYKLFGIFVGPSYTFIYNRSKFKGSISYGINMYSMPLVYYYQQGNEILIEEGAMSSFNLDLCYSFAVTKKLSLVFRMDYTQGTNFDDSKYNDQIRGFCNSLGVGYRF